MDERNCTLTDTSSTVTNTPFFHRPLPFQRAVWPSEAFNSSGSGTTRAHGSSSARSWLWVRRHRLVNHDEGQRVRQHHRRSVARVPTTQRRLVDMTTAMYVNQVRCLNICIVIPRKLLKLPFKIWWQYDHVNIVISISFEGFPSDIRFLCLLGIQKEYKKKTEKDRKRSKRMR